MTSLPLSYEISLPESEKRHSDFVKLLLKNNALRDALESKFQLRLDNFPIFEKGNVIIGFNTDAANEDNARNAINYLRKRYVAGEYIDETTVKKAYSKIVLGNEEENNNNNSAKGTAMNSKRAHNDNRSNRDERRSSFNGAAKSAWETREKPYTKGSYKFVSRSPEQTEMVKLVDKNHFIFGVGPAGTGKTHVAFAMAIEALQAGKIKKIVVARPALQAGEDIGFLPGTKDEKLEEYMRPFYDMLEEAFGRNAPQDMLADKTLELLHVGFGRGRTLNDCYVIFDEAQNALYKQIYLMVTRGGENCKMFITGDTDPSQIDLANPEDSGLWKAMEDMKGPGVGINQFSDKYVVRSEMAKIAVERMGNRLNKEKALEATAPKTAKKTNNTPKA